MWWTALLVTACSTISRAAFASGVDFLGKFMWASPFRMLNKGASCHVVNPRCDLSQFTVPKSFFASFKIWNFVESRIVCSYMVWSMIWSPGYFQAGGSCAFSGATCSQNVFNAFIRLGWINERTFLVWVAIKISSLWRWQYTPGNCSLIDNNAWAVYDWQTVGLFFIGCGKTFHW